LPKTPFSLLTLSPKNIKVRILFFIDSFPAGGKERRLVELMKGLKATPGVEFGIVIMSNDIHYKEIYDMGIPVHQVIRKSKKDISVIPRFIKLCREFKPDIAHCWDSMTAVYLVPVTRWLGIKLVNGMIADAPAVQNSRNKTWLRGKLTFPFSHRVIGNSKAGLKAYGAPLKRSVCIYNGFDFARSESVKDGETIKSGLGIQTPIVVGMVASFSIFKDYATYFRAAENILEKYPGVTFLAIGDDTDSPEARSLVNEKWVQNFRFLGRSSGIESFVNIMDICILSTYTEGISNAILEYMAMGKPVIATEGGGTSEIVADQETGFLVPPSRPDIMQEKLEILINDPAMRNRMGIAGRQRVKDIFSIGSMMNGFISEYRKLAHRN
jgi:glycosyltransferase involved in cell wall biosynthesis